MQSQYPKEVGLFLDTKQIVIGFDKPVSQYPKEVGLFLEVVKWILSPMEK